MTQSPTGATPLTALSSWVQDARERTFELVEDLTDEQLYGERLPTVNPLLWEIGHAAWFHEKWVLRHYAGGPPLRGNADGLWDSIAIAHDTRWDLPLPTRKETLEYLRNVRDEVLEVLEKDRESTRLAYLVQYAVFHEDMHNEAFTYTRQTLGYPAPKLGIVPEKVNDGGARRLGGEGSFGGDTEVPGGVFALGAGDDGRFVFDNEKWSHPVDVEPFGIARAPVTQQEFAAFVADGGYRRRELWSDAGWSWLEDVGAEHPVYWKQESNGSWLRRHFDTWVSLEPSNPAIHVNWYEASAYCRWAGRRLPTEAEWEAAASAEPSAERRVLVERKRRYPWGDEPANVERANLDWRAMGCVGVSTLPGGDSAFGCRNMIGNLWEWTDSDFLPYPGFVPDMYKEYSEPLFKTHKVTRGGSWATRARLIRNTWRNYALPHRRDLWVGFRTCALRD